MNKITLADAERYVFAGLQYRDGEFDCGSLAVLVQRELFGREVNVPPAGERSRGRAGQHRDILRIQPEVCEKVEAPETGDAVVFWATEGRERRWHIGTVFLRDGEVWVLHIPDEIRGVALQRLVDLQAEGQCFDAFYRWKTPKWDYPTPPPVGGDGYTLAVAAHPMLQAAVEVRHVAAGKTLAETLAENGVAGTGYVVTVQGREVPQAMWSRTRVKVGMVVEARAVVRKQVLQLVAILVLTYFTFGLGTFGAAGSLAATSGFAVAAAVFVGGSILINKFLGPKLGSMGDMSAETVPPTYSLQGGRNTARQWQPLSLVLGHTKAIPDLANQPYTWLESDDQYLSTLLHAGINCGSVADLKNGDTLLSTYEDVTIRKYGFPSGDSDTAPVLGTSVDTVTGGQLDAPDGVEGPWRTATSSPGTARLEIDIQGTLSALNSKGKAETATAVIEIQYQAVGGSVWLPFNGGPITLTNLGQKTLRRTFKEDVPVGQYTVRARKITPDPENDNLRQQVLEWTVLRSFQPDLADYGGQPRVEVRVKASGQISGSLDELNWIATAAPMPIWDGSAWQTATAPGAAGLSNPGAQILMLLRGIYRPSDGRLIAGAGLPDRRIDIESLKAFMVRCTAMNFTFDAMVQEKISLKDLLQSIAYAGLGTLTDNSGKIGVTYAAESQPIEGVVNMVAMKAQSFELAYTLATTADEYQLEFFDRDSSWSWQSVRVRAPGVVTPQFSSSENVRGITRREHAAVLARFSQGQNLYGRKTITWEMDLEHLRYRRGAVVALSHDLTQWGYGGGCYAITTAAGSFTVTVDEPVPSDGATTRTLGINVPGEASMRVFPVASISSDGRRITVNQSWPAIAPLPGVDGLRAHDFRWIYDLKESPGYRVRILSIEPDNDLKGARVTASPDSPEFWNYVINGEYIPPPNNSLLTRDIPVASNLQVRRIRVRVGDGWEHRLEATWDIRGQYASAQVWSGVPGAPLEIVEGGTTILGTSHTWRVPPDQVWNVEVRPFDELGRPGVKAAITYADPSVTVGAVQNLTVTPTPIGMQASWTAPEVDWLSTVLRLGTTWELGQQVFNGRADRHNLGWLAADEYLLWAAHINSADDLSPPVAFAFEILAPLQPIVIASPEINEARLTWGECKTTQPLRGYEVRIGDTYDESVLVAFTNGLGIVHTPPTSGTHLYWVTAVDLADNRGPSGYATVTTLPGITEAIDELQDGLDDAFQGIADNKADIDAINAQLADITGAPDWSATDTYAESAVVKHAGGLWASTADGNINHEPAIGSTWWTKIGDYESLGEAVAAHAVQLSNHDTRITATEDGLEAESERIDLLAASITSAGADSLIADPELAQGVASWAPTTGLTAYDATDAGVPASAPAARLVSAAAQPTGERFNGRLLRGAVNTAGDVVRVTPGEQIDVALWMYLVGTSAGATTLVARYGATDDPSTQVVLATYTGSGWKQLTGTFTTPAGASFVRFGVRRSLTGAEGLAWYAGMQATRRGAAQVAINAAILNEQNARATAIEAEATARQAVVASITSGSSNNLITNPTFDPAGWRYGVEAGTTVDYFARADAGVPASAPSARVMRLTKNTALGVWSGRSIRFKSDAATLVEARPGEVVDFSVQVWAPSGTPANSVNVQVFAVDAANAVISSSAIFRFYNSAAGGWQTLSGALTLPAGTVAFAGHFVTNESAPINQVMWIAEPDVRKRSASSLVLGASVQATSTALATLDGKVAASYTLTVTAGNKVAGFRVGTDGATSDFVVLADKFAWGYESLGQIKYGLVLGLIDGVASFGFSGNMYLDGTLQARMIGADQIRAVHIRTNEIEARHVKAGAVSADKVSVGVSGNLLKNSAIVTTEGWNFYDNIGGVTSGRNIAGDSWRAGNEDNLSMVQFSSGNNNLDAGWYCDIAGEAGKRYCVSSYSAAHRCFTDVLLVFLDSAGGFIDLAASPQQQAGGGKLLGNWNRQFAFGVAPAGTAFIRAQFRKTPTLAGNSDSYAWFTRPMLEEATRYQTQPSNYQVAGQGTVITPDGIRTPSLGAMSPNLGLVVYGRLESSDGQMAVNMDSKTIYFTKNGRRFQVASNGLYIGDNGGVANFLRYDLDTGLLLLRGAFTADTINAVDTLNVRGGAITSMRFAQGGSVSSAPGTTLIAQGIVMVSGSSGVVIDASAELAITTSGSVGANCQIGIYKDSNGQLLRFVTLSFGALNSFSTQAPVSLAAFDPSPSVGWGTYSLRVLSSSGTVIVQSSTITLTGGQR